MSVSVSVSVSVSMSMSMSISVFVSVCAPVSVFASVAVSVCVSVSMSGTLIYKIYQSIIFWICQYVLISWICVGWDIEYCGCGMCEYAGYFDR